MKHKEIAIYNFSASKAEETVHVLDFDIMAVQGKSGFRLAVLGRKARVARISTESTLEYL